MSLDHTPELLSPSKQRLSIAIMTLGQVVCFCVQWRGNTVQYFRCRLVTIPKSQYWEFQLEVLESYGDTIISALPWEVLSYGIGFLEGKIVESWEFYRHHPNLPSPEEVRKQVQWLNDAIMRDELYIQYNERLTSLFSAVNAIFGSHSIWYFKRIRLIPLRGHLDTLRHTIIHEASFPHNSWLQEIITRIDKLLWAIEVTYFIYPTHKAVFIA